MPSMVRLMYQFQTCWNKGRLCWKIAKLFYFCHLRKLVRPETFGPYHVTYRHKIFISLTPKFSHSYCQSAALWEPQVRQSQHQLLNHHGRIITNDICRTSSLSRKKRRQYRRCVILTVVLYLLKTKRNLLYVRNQFVPRSKHFLPRL